MIDKGYCGQCGHKIQATLHQKCMYCGAPLADEQAFSDDEKQQIIMQQQQQEIERLRTELAKAKAEIQRLKRGKGSGGSSINWVGNGF